MAALFCHLAVLERTTTSPSLAQNAPVTLFLSASKHRTFLVWWQNRFLVKLVDSFGLCVQWCIPALAGQFEIRASFKSDVAVRGALRGALLSSGPVIPSGISLLSGSRLRNLERTISVVHAVDGLLGSLSLLGCGEVDKAEVASALTLLARAHSLADSIAKPRVSETELFATAG